MVSSFFLHQNFAIMMLDMPLLLFSNFPKINHLLIKLLPIGGVYLLWALHWGVVEKWHTLGKNPTCIPPDFNSSMLVIWEEMWHSMPQSCTISVTVHGLLQQYRKRCRAKRKRPRDASESPPALLPISFALAKDWLLKQQKAQSKALETGAVNEEVREMVADLNRSLAEQLASTATLDVSARLFFHAQCFNVKTLTFLEINICSG